MRGAAVSRAGLTVVHDRSRRSTLSRAGLVVGLAALAIPGIYVAMRERNAPHARTMMHHGGGVPVAIVVDRPAAGYLTSIWADPVVGTSTVYAVLRSADGSSFHAPARVRIGIAPVAGDEPEVVLATHDEPAHAGRKYMANMTLSRPERWKIRVLIDAADAVGDVSAQVQATPPLGHGLPGLLLASVPFFVVGGLFWRRAAVRRQTVQGG